MARRYAVLTVVVTSIIAALALETKPLQAAASSLGASLNAPRGTSSITPTTIRPLTLLRSLREPQRLEQQQGGGGQTPPRIWTDQPVDQQFAYACTRFLCRRDYGVRQGKHARVVEAVV